MPTYHQAARTRSILEPMAATCNHSPRSGDREHCLHMVQCDKQMSSKKKKKSANTRVTNAGSAGFTLKHKHTADWASFT